MGAPPARNSAATTSGRTKASGLTNAIKEDGARKQAKDAFEAHTKATGSMDLLDRCKKLNEFLSSVRIDLHRPTAMGLPSYFPSSPVPWQDFMKGGPLCASPGGNKAQLKEMLAILNAGPKRPSFLDKPPVTATAGVKKPPQSTASSGSPSHATTRNATLSLAESAMLSRKEADKLLDLIQFEPDDQALR
jgi:hypothetical protein